MCVKVRTPTYMSLLSVQPEPPRGRTNSQVMFRSNSGSCASCCCFLPTALGPQVCVPLSEALSRPHRLIHITPSCSGHVSGSMLQCFAPPSTKDDNLVLFAPSNRNAGLPKGRASPFGRQAHVCQTDMQFNSIPEQNRINLN